jgi:hypothetical protein
MKKAFLVVLPFLFVALAWGDIVQLKDGSYIKGKVLKADSSAIVIKDDKGIEQTIEKDKVLYVTWEPGSQPIGTPVTNEPPESLHSRLFPPSETPTFKINRGEVIEAANSLRTYRNYFYGGFATEIIGMIVGQVGLYSKNSGFFIVGAVGILAGAIIQFIGVNSVGEAGDHLDKVTIYLTDANHSDLDKARDEALSALRNQKGDIVPPPYLFSVGTMLPEHIGPFGNENNEKALRQISFRIFVHFQHFNSMDNTHFEGEICVFYCCMEE